MGLQIEFKKKNLFLHLKVKGLEQGSETLTQIMLKNIFYTIAYDKKIYGSAKNKKETSYYSMWVCQGNLRLEKRISTEIGEDFGLRKAKRRKCAN